ncbi:MAG: alpha/beta hydrolase [Nitriliruptorales bacterium]
MTNGVLVDEVSFDVRISSGGLLGGLLGGLVSGGGAPTDWIVRGSLYRPSHAPRCTSSVLLLLHGVSQSRHVWDLRAGGLHYSAAHRLASAGYPVVAVDRLGYGTSGRPSGRDLTIQAHASVTAQIVTALRSGSYGGGPGLGFTHVGLVGHSLGTEIAELCVGSPNSGGEVDVLIATGYTHFTSLRLLGAMAGMLGPALLTNYVYFGGSPENRTELFYDSAGTDAAIVAEETRRANLTPSGEILSVIGRPSGAVIGAITLPVLLLLAERDVLFPSGEGLAELGLFTSAPDRELRTVPESGHVLFLHRRWTYAVDEILAWLGRHPGELPAC